MEMSKEVLEGSSEEDESCLHTEGVCSKVEDECPEVDPVCQNAARGKGSRLWGRVRNALRGRKVIADSVHVLGCESLA